MKPREVAFQQLHEDKSLQISEFDKAQSKKWDTFVRDSNNGTIFHTRQFLNYHSAELFQDCSLLFSNNQNWLALLPAVIRKSGRITELVSHAGASFGGPVTKSNLSLKDAFRVVQALIRYATEAKVDRIVMTLPPQFYYGRPSNYIDFALLEFGFTYKKREISSVIPLDFAEEDTLLIFNQESGRAVRKAIKMGLEVKESSDFEVFYAILNKNLKLRHNVKPTHSLDDLLKLTSIFPNQIKLFGAYFDDKMVAGIVIFECNRKAALAFYISHDEDLQQYRGVNLLFYQVVRWAIRQKFRFLDFGIFTVDMLPNWGLAKFKESFGAQGVFRDTFVKTL